MSVAVHPLVSPWGRFGLYSWFIDTAEPAIVDTGIASSPTEGMAPALEALGRRIEDVRWILLTHGHIDHVGGAAALRELTGGRAHVVIGEPDACFVRSRGSHAEEYARGRGRYLADPDSVAHQHAAAAEVVSGELEPDMLVADGATLDLGDATVTVHAVPGHTDGSVAFEITGQGDVFVGDTVQVHGAANGFPGYTDPDAYRASLERLRELDPRRLFLGHPYRGTDGEAVGLQLEGPRVREVLDESLMIEARVAEAAERALAAGIPDLDAPDYAARRAAAGSPYWPFGAVAEALGYTGDPTREPSPFFTTLDGYRRRLERTGDA